MQSLLALRWPGPSFHLVPHAGTVLSSGAIMRAHGMAQAWPLGQESLLWT